MYLAEDWGAERNAWLVELSYTLAASLGALFLLGMLIIFRVPVLKLLSVPARPFAFLLTWTRYVITSTPLRHPFRRYLYTGRHLSLQEA